FQALAALGGTEAAAGFLDDLFGLEPPNVYAASLGELPDEAHEDVLSLLGAHLLTADLGDEEALSRVDRVARRLAPGDWSQEDTAALSALVTARDQESYAASRARLAELTERKTGRASAGILALGGVFLDLRSAHPWGVNLLDDLARTGWLSGSTANLLSKAARPLSQATSSLGRMALQGAQVAGKLAPILGAATSLVNLARDWGDPGMMTADVLSLAGSVALVAGATGIGVPLVILGSALALAFSYELPPESRYYAELVSPSYAHNPAVESLLFLTSTDPEFRSFVDSVAGASGLPPYRALEVLAGLPPGTMMELHIDPSRAGEILDV
ncbi:MAG: hypothetical protein AB1758_24290, partial [Candidatus Eremiobacterota bacterium]